MLEQAGLPDIRFHDLRHTFATHALTSGVDVKTLSGIWGMQERFTDMQKRAAEIVGEFPDRYLRRGAEAMGRKTQER